MNSIASGDHPVAVSIGEPAGIGPEVILKAWQARKERNLPVFFVIGDPDFLTRLAAETGLDVPVETCAPKDAARVFPRALPCLPVSGKVQAKAGNPAPGDGALVCEAIETGVDLCIKGKAAGLVTAPIHKKSLYESGFKFPGHTEYLAELSEQLTGKPNRPVMMLAGPQLRTVPVTIHIALRDVFNVLTRELIVETAQITAADLKARFGIENPVLAISGLNPHAGEGGSMGIEEVEIIEPAIQELAGSGIKCIGPLPADTMFHEAARTRYDAALCMYHDQALIPAKTLGFDDAVNVTLGLPFIRTSPDHGTAFDIAGRGIANPSSMIAAIRMAGDMAARETTQLKHSLA